MPELKKLVLKVEVQDLKDKKKAMKVVSSLSGIDSLSMDMKDKKLTVVGDFDPVEVVSKLRKHWRSTEIVTVGPAKEAEKKKEEPKKEEEKKKEDKNKTDSEMYADLMKAYKNYNPYVTQNPYMTQQYAVHSAEENPNSCAIC